jgi:hypothetical protein
MESEPAVFPCACMGPIGIDPECPCRMRAKGLTPTEIWTPEARRQLDEALKQLVLREQEDALLNSPQNKTRGKAV